MLLLLSSSLALLIANPLRLPCLLCMLALLSSLSPTLMCLRRLGRKLLLLLLLLLLLPPLPPLPPLLLLPLSAGSFSPLLLLLPLLLVLSAGSFSPLLLLPSLLALGYSSCRCSSVFCCTRSDALKRYLHTHAGTHMSARVVGP
jgi:hypothetical protein